MSRCDVTLAARSKELGLPARAKRAQRPREKANWVVFPPSRAMRTLLGSLTTAPTGPSEISRDVEVIQKLNLNRRPPIGVTSPIS